MFWSIFIECNCPQIGTLDGLGGLFDNFLNRIKVSNGSFSECNYLKPYLNPVKEHTIIIVICTNEIFAIVRVPMCVFQYKLTSTVEMLSFFFHVARFFQSIEWFFTSVQFCFNCGVLLSPLWYSWFLSYWEKFLKLYTC